jgi:hypothetical protein
MQDLIIISGVLVSIQRKFSEKQLFLCPDQGAEIKIFNDAGKKRKGKEVLFRKGIVDSRYEEAKLR